MSSAALCKVSGFSWNLPFRGTQGRTNADASLICSECGFNDAPGNLHQACGMKRSETQALVVQAPLQCVREGTKAHLTPSVRGTEQNPQPRAGCLGVTEEPQHADRWWEDGWVVLRGNLGSMPASRDITHDLCRELVTCLGLTENVYLCCFT